MRENESDSEGGQKQPPEYVNPWAARDQGEAAGVSDADPSTTSPLEQHPQDTIAFSMPPSERGRRPPGSPEPPAFGTQPGYGQAGYGQPEAGQPEAGNQAGSGQPAGGPQPWYGNQAGYRQNSFGNQTEPGYGSQPGYQDQPGYGSQPGYQNQPGYGSQPGYQNQPGYGSQPGYGQAGFGRPGYGDGQGAGDSGGFTTSGWAQPGAAPPERPGHGGRFLIYLAVAALAASIGAGVTVAVASHNSASAPTVSAGDIPGPHNNASGSGSSAPLNQAAVKKKVDPGLVDITSTLRYDSESAEGTGMILSASGLVITNNHVIDGATSISARLVGGSHQTYTARVVGYDVTDDVALLQLVGASGLTPVSFGNSAQVRLGTTVLALGNAEGQGGAKPAAGIINALNRSIQASDEGSNTTEDLNHMLQTDALIQQGDSGGALANNAGQVIGMITAANTSTSSSVGPSGGTLGFAIPINTALALAKQIAGHKSSSTVYIGMPGFLGVEVVGQSGSSNPQQQAANGQQQSSGGSLPGGNGASCQPNNQPVGVPARIAPAGKGALVIGVLCGTVAQAKGIAAGDVITTFDGHQITTPGSLTAMTARYHPGDVVTIDWVGVNGAKHASSITLGSGPAH